MSLIELEKYLHDHIPLSKAMEVGVVQSQSEAVILSAPLPPNIGLPEHPASVLKLPHSGVRPKEASIPYAASKAALIHVTRLLPKTLGPDIRVNAIAPGLVDTPLTEEVWATIREQWIRDAPMRRCAP